MRQQSYLEVELPTVARPATFFYVASLAIHWLVSPAKVKSGYDVGHARN